LHKLATLLPKYAQYTLTEKEDETHLAVIDILQALGPILLPYTTTLPKLTL